ncbi:MULTISPECIES: aromatic amino acid transport family protein [Vibrio]|jgi:tyrosine-specific transport protein|uniref:aromatic amino acid transport family protein n=1 Tax=Vibrio TaxID=662 RepID=UPI0003157B44|nr:MULTISPECIES: aromatic amino acid transport family protein [Vibrio]OED74426.1 tyrosine transporter TyrP [Vibrio crassostreae ZF-91]OEF01893.1 tyrosine transporter TyrP [Vibrio crassostreae 9ZC13]TKG05699.1 amino acid permease [Vibrio sp. F13]CDT46893.1 Tyrosine-specific transport protein [Vibrio coralliirubri]CDT72998.1 Tyrosine-specific transport protein [Vibrio coralliirubri]
MNKSKVFGSTLIIAGTTIGAGMLALPLASAGIGFSTSLFLMLGLWALMAFTALLMVELHQFAESDATLHTLAHTILGTKGKWIASFAVMFLFYALCAAYIAGGGAQFNQRISDIAGIELNAQITTLLFTLLVAGVVTIGTHSVDKVNRVLFGLKLIAMVLVLSFLAPNITSQYLMSMPLQQGLIVAAIPVVFTSFGFHGSIPSIVRYLDGDVRSLRKVMIIGSALPLVIYVFWQSVTLGVISQEQLLSDTSLGALLVSLSQTVHQSNLSVIVGVFADLALLTSFIGVSLGLFEFMGDSLSKKLGNAKRVKTAAITFLPPLGFALFYPQGFIMALGYAAIALSVLAILLPTVMVYKVRYTDFSVKPQSAEASYQVLGGSKALFLAGSVGVFIIAIQVLISVGLLPSLG